MRKIVFLMITAICHSQNYKPTISARVDTTKLNIKKVYDLYTNYLNSKPDSIYSNSFWKKSEVEEALKNKYLKIDRAAEIMFNGMKSDEFIEYYQPKIIQIDSVDINRYQIKTIYNADCPENEYKKYTPSYITKLYAVKDNDGNFKLENCLNYLTKNWKKLKKGTITYVIHPACFYNKIQVKKAELFIKEISKRFDLEKTDFTYYVLPNSDELGKLYNFEYWNFYIGGQTIIQKKEIFTTYSNFDYNHEIVHMIFKKNDTIKLDNTILFSEGIATWLAGAGYNESFENGLTRTSKKLKQYNKITFDDITNFKIRNEFDNTILYITGAVICKMIYEKHGKDGIWEFYYATKENYKNILENLFEKKINEIEIDVFNYILNETNP
jgi:hypothetical protein